MDRTVTMTPQDLSMNYFERFSEEDLIEIRCINSSGARRFWILPHEFASLEPKLLGLNKKGFGIFASVNPRCCQGSKESDVPALVAFHVDIDCPGCFAGKSTQKEGSSPVPIPSLVVNSGHGWHLYWRLREPCLVDNLAHLKAINRGLAHAVGGDAACCDLSRILRIPGFINHKPPAMPVEIVAQHPVSYTLEEMASFAVEVPTTQAVVLDEIPKMDAELKERFHQVRRADKTKQLTRAWRGEIGDGSSDSRYVLVKMLAESGQFSSEEIVAITCGRRWYNKKSKQLKAPEAVQEDAIRLVGKLA